tara:strand:+ start:199 stop:582 length:384 start_codon:yes stop_codon:yes gene_type:complete
LSDNPGHTKGNITEYLAIIRFLKEGYNVYKNVESHGQIDLIVESRKTRKLLRVDVKALNYINGAGKTRVSGAKLKPNQKGYPEDGIVFLVVDDDGCMWIQGYIKDRNKQSIIRDDRFKESMRRLGMD